MRLRYLHLPRYGPLRNIEVVFEQETLLNRTGALNFVVGVNGTGKSSLLRAVAEVFRALDSGNVPRFAVTLGWDVNVEDKARTALFHFPGGARSEAHFVLLDGLFVESPTENWQRWIAISRTSGQRHDAVSGDQLEGAPVLRASLPRPVLVYTSGESAPWNRAEEALFPEEELPAEQEEQLPTERPAGWSIEKELHSSLTVKEELREQAVGVWENAPARVGMPRCLRVDTAELRLAAATAMLIQSAHDLHAHDTEPALKAWADRLTTDFREKNTTLPPVHKLMQEVNWRQATHLSVVIHRQRVTTPERRALVWILYALAEEVVDLPLGLQQAVIALGHQDAAGRVSKAVDGHFTKNAPAEIAQALKDINGAKSGAEALVRLFSQKREHWPLFEALVSLSRAGILESLNFTVQRVPPELKPGQESSYDVIAYDSFSDGEQMLLGRMSLLFLLQGQTNGLLLLDEPETHFNDVWKREIVSFVDAAGSLKTANQVIIATHSAIALTDVFGSEIIQLRRGAKGTEAVSVALPTFGADPSRIMTDVFGAPQSIGERAFDELEKWLREPPKTREELAEIVERIGGGLHRAELRALLQKMDHAASHPTST